MHIAEQPKEAVTTACVCSSGASREGVPHRRNRHCAPSGSTKGDGSVIRAPFKPWRSLAMLEDGGEEAEVAGVYLMMERRSAPHRNGGGE